MNFQEAENQINQKQAPWLHQSKIEIYDKVQEHIDQIVNSLSETYYIDHDISLLYLLKCKWNVDSINESFCDDPDFSLKLGIPYEKQLMKISTDINTSNTSNIQDINQTSSTECPICSCVMNLNNFVVFYCGHFVCKSCFEAYISSQRISISDDCCILCCMQDEQTNEDCKCPILPSLIQSYCSSSISDWYSQIVQSYFIKYSTKYYQCPSLNDKCNNIIVRQGYFTGPLQCSCGTFACYKCKQLYHIPATCDEYKSFLSLYKSNEFDWLNDNVKACPSCKILVERNKGCNHMICPKCKYEFCWICMVEWSKHGGSFYKCNRLDDKYMMSRADTLIGQSTLSVNRNGFFTRRYKNYLDNYEYILTLITSLNTIKETYYNQNQQEYYKIHFFEVILFSLNQLSYCYLVIASSYVLIDQRNETSYNYDLFANFQGLFESLTDSFFEYIQPFIVNLQEGTISSNTVIYYNQIIENIHSKLYTLYTHRNSLLDTKSYSKE